MERDWIFIHLFGMDEVYGVVQTNRQQIWFKAGAHHVEGLPAAGGL